MGFGLLGLAAASAGCRAPGASASARPGVNGGQEVSIDALDNRFSARLVFVDRGKPLTVAVHNSGLMSHTFSTGDGQADVVVPRGETKKISFRPTRSTNFFCRFHEANGMKGSLCVRGQRCTPQAFP